jgi:RNA recognition motif-containing protein
MEAKKLFVGNFPFSTTDQDLKDLFSGYGTVMSATVVMDRETGRSRGFAFVEMSTPEEAKAAITNLNHVNYAPDGRNERELNVTLARAKRSYS